MENNLKNQNQNSNQANLSPKPSQPSRLHIIKEYEIKREFWFSSTGSKFFDYLGIFTTFALIVGGLFGIIKILIILSLPSIGNPDSTTSTGSLVFLAIALSLEITLILWYLYNLWFNKKRKLIIAEEGFVFTIPKTLNDWSYFSGFKIEGQRIIFFKKHDMTTNDPSVTNPLVNLGNNCDEAAEIISKFLKREGKETNPRN